MNAIKLYVNELDPGTAACVVAKYTTNTCVTFAGSGAMNTQGDYIRIDGPSVWIEYSAQGSREIAGLSTLIRGGEIVPATMGE